MNHSPSAPVEVPCPVCGNPNWEVYVLAPSHYGPESHQVTKCTACGMIYTNPQSQTYLAEVENRGALDRHFFPERLARMRNHARLLLRLVARHTQGRSFLDFGCGAGGMVQTALEEGWKAIGYDLNSGLVAAANKHWSFNLLETGPLENFYSRHQGSFDAIIAFQVFEHLQEPLVAGRNLASLLRPGGVLLVDVPFVYQPRELIRRGVTLDPTAHWCHFSKATLSLLMERIGLEVVYRNAAPSLVSVYHRLGMGKFSVSLGLLTKAVSPPIGSGVCVIARKRA